MATWHGTWHWMFHNQTCSAPACQSSWLWQFCSCDTAGLKTRNVVYRAQLHVLNPTEGPGGGGAQLLDRTKGSKMGETPLLDWTKWSKMGETKHPQMSRCLGTQTLKNSKVVGHKILGRESEREKKRETGKRKMALPGMRMYALNNHDWQNIYSSYTNKLDPLLTLT